MSSERSRRPSWLTFWPVPVVALAGAVVLVGVLRGDARPAAAPAGDVEGTARLQQEVAMLRARLGAVERRPEAAAAAPAAAVDKGGPAAGGAPAAEPAAPPADDDDRRRYFADVEVRFGGEPRDPVWASATEERLHRTGDGLGPGLSIETVRCGQSTCRLELKRDTDRVTPLALVTYARAVATVLPEVVVHYPDDATRVVFYLQREGAAGFPPLVGQAAAGE